MLDSEHHDTPDQSVGTGPTHTYPRGRSVPTAYGRERHQANLRTILGADLWLKSDGTPRQKMNDQHVTRAISDGNHAPAGQAMEALFRLLPMSTRTVTDPRDHSDCGYAHYGLVGRDSDHVSYQTTTYVEDRHRADPIARKHLLNHAFAVESILPSFRYENTFDSLLIDVDVDLWGDSIDLFVLPPDEIAEIIAPWHSTLTRMGIPARFMLSGFRGFWIQVMLSESVYRYRAEHLYHTICRASGATWDGSKYRLPGEYIGYAAESGCLSDHVCRLPWSLREDGPNISVHVDPQTGGVDPTGLLFWEEWDPADLFPSYATCGCGISTIEVERDDDQHGGRFDTEDTGPPYATCGCGISADDATTATDPPPHLDWDWSDVEAEALGGDRIGSDTWEDAIITDVPQGDRWNVLTHGNIALVSARMLHDLGHIDWDELRAAYRRAYPVQNRKGGTTDKWVGDWKRISKKRPDITPCPPWLSTDDVTMCRRYADEIVAGITRRGPKPDHDEIYHVLLVMCRLTQPGRGEIATDFLARKAGINPYRTWEAQAAVEGVEEVEGDYIASVRHNRTSKNARDRLLRIMAYVCDLDPSVFTGRHPFRRTRIGSNDRSDPRVVARDKPVGSEFERVEGHPFWLVD